MSRFEPSFVAYVILICLLSIADTCAQITAVRLGSLAGLCTLPTPQVLVLPNQFNRSLEAPLTSTADDVQLNDLSNCQFISFDPSFEVLLGGNRTIYQLGGNFTSDVAFEGPVYLPETDEVVFNSFLTGQINRVSLQTGQLTPVPLQSPVGGANGATNYKGGVAVTTFGNFVEEGVPPGVIQLNPYTGIWTWIINNWFGLHLGGPDDIVALTDGSLIFTDTDYAYIFGVSPGSAQTQEAVYIIPPNGPARVLINNVPGTGTPNGVALSPDQQTLYVSTTPLHITMPNNLPVSEKLTSHSIYAYDLALRNGGTFAQNMRVFCSTDVGYPDGFKVDRDGNVWSSAGDGIHIFNPAGSLIGKIIIPNASIPPNSEQTVNQLAFAGSRLVIMHHTNVLMLPLNVTGPILA
ncbi:hypothetical protein WJX74_009390 [Apatococcus lobatus]|uniref:SMP-30/Gluconolactonase/LRE-like region domain-containing protein n=1 Tax=Apatococcus lobatus TaxID=904363 RepID=A0AAW1Q444_9CHLO